MVKVGGKRNTHKVGKNTLILQKQGDIFKSRGEMYWNRKNRGETKNCSRLKKGHQKFWLMKIGKFFGKRYIWKNFPQSLKCFSEIGGNLKQGVNASLPQRGWTPLTRGIEWPDRPSAHAHPRCWNGLLREAVREKISSWVGRLIERKQNEWQRHKYTDAVILKQRD